MPSGGQMGPVALSLSTGGDSAWPSLEASRLVFILADFQRAYGWRVGVDGSIVVVTIGAGGSIDTDTLTSPVIAFIFDQQGLMYNLSLEGSKISRISR